MRREGDRFPLRMLLLISQIGITMMVPIFFCAWLGSLVVKKTGIELLFVLFLIIGILAGFRSCYHMIRRFTSLKSGSSGTESAAGPASSSGKESESDDDWIDDPENRLEDPGR